MRATERFRDAARRAAAGPAKGSDDDIEINPGEPLIVTIQKLAAAGAAAHQHVPKARPRVGGRALQDPDDRREARFAMRLHHDLMEQLAAIAREKGCKVSQVIEDVLIEFVNTKAGEPVVDAIGRSLRRKCLSCGRKFWSAGVHKRICDACKRDDQGGTVRRKLKNFN
jgi:hypothetical protein